MRRTGYDPRDPRYTPRVVPVVSDETKDRMRVVLDRLHALTKPSELMPATLDVHQRHRRVPVLEALPLALFGWLDEVWR